MPNTVFILTQAQNNVNCFLFLSQMLNSNKLKQINKFLNSHFLKIKHIKEFHLSEKRALLQTIYEDKLKKLETKLFLIWQNVQGVCVLKNNVIAIAQRVFFIYGQPLIILTQLARRI